MRQSSPLPLVSVGKAVAGTVIIAALMLIVPLAPVVLAPFLALPLAYVVTRHGWVSGAAVAVVSPVLLYFGAGIGTALLVFMVIVESGHDFGMGVAKRVAVSPKPCRNGRLVAGGSGRVRGGPVAGVRAQPHRTQAGSQRLDRQRRADVRRDGREFASTIAAVSGQLRKLVDIFPYLAPGFVGAAVVLVTASTLGLAYVLFPRLRQRDAGAPCPCPTFRMHWGVAYVSIVGLAMLLVLAGRRALALGLVVRRHRSAAGIADLVLLAGAGSASLVRSQQGWQPGSRTLLFISAVLAQAFFQLTGLLGLLDTWIDYRKRFAFKSPGPGPLR